jgi:hypothetical protein
MACIKGCIEPLGEDGSADELRAPGRREQLGGENRSRHHHPDDRSPGILRCAPPSDGEAAMRGIFGSERYAMV